MRKTNPLGLITKEIASRVRALRNRHGLSDAEVAEDLGFSRGHWSALERGKYRFTVESLGKVADYYGVPITDLLFDEKELVKLQPALKLSKEFFEAHADKKFRDALAAFVKAYHKRSKDWSYEACRRLLLL